MKGRYNESEVVEDIRYLFMTGAQDTKLLYRRIIQQCLVYSLDQEQTVSLATSLYNAGVSECKNTFDFWANLRKILSEEYKRSLTREVFVLKNILQQQMDRAQNRA